MKSKKVLNFLYYLSWIVFIGLCVKTGTLIVSYFISINRPEISGYLFGEINLSEYYNYSFYQYSLILLYKIIVYALEAYIALQIILLIEKLNLKKPFTEGVSSIMKKISSVMLFLWIAVVIHNIHMTYIAKANDFIIDTFSTDFIFLAGIIFIFAQIINKGIELQQENDLTI